MSIRLIMAAALAVTLVSSTAVGETFTVEDQYARFQLFADCGPMRLVITQLSEDAKKIGLTTEAIQAAAESRLRAARLCSAETNPLLVIAVNVVGQAFNVGPRYNKEVLDPLSGFRFLTPFWNANFTGQHGGNSGYILSGVSGQLDKFLVKYLRVNEEACGKR